MPHSLAHSGYNPGEPTNEVDYINSDPNEQLGFEISPSDVSWTFIPEFYPDDFTQMKKKELSRYGGNCGGESVSIKAIKNREFHITGVLLQGEINIFQGLLDYEGVVDLLSPLTPSGGMECYVKKGEIGNQQGWDPHQRQWMFKFTLDLVSTGRDEHDTGTNDIVSAIIGSSPGCTYKGHPRSEWSYTGEGEYEIERFEEWQKCEITTDTFQGETEPGKGTALLTHDG